MHIGRRIRRCRARRRHLLKLEFRNVRLNLARLQSDLEEHRRFWGNWKLGDPLPADSVPRGAVPITTEIALWTRRAGRLARSLGIQRV